MTKAEKRIVRLAILLVLLSFFLNSYFSRIAASAQTTTATPSCTTKIEWSTRQAEKCEHEAWAILREEYSEIAAAAIMGNLLHESGFCPWRYESLSYDESYKLTQLYRDDHDKFVYSAHGFGLACWSGPHNLEKLWNYCKEHGYEVYELEGQIRFLMEDYKASAPESAMRLNCYKLDEISMASEEFRQSYEKATSDEYSQYKRAKYAKTMYAGLCEDIYTIEEVSTSIFNYDISEKVKELNKELGIK